MSTLILTNSNSINISETFIKKHIDLLGSAHLNLYTYGKMEIGDNNRFIKRLLINTITYLNYLKFKKTVKKKNISVVVAEYGVVGADAVDFCKKIKIPLVVHFHGYDAHQKKIINLYKERYLKMFEYAQSIIVVSSKMYQAILEMGAKREKVITIPYGVDTSEFTNANIVKKNYQAFSVGRFVNKKAPYLLILSFEMVVKQIPQAKLYIGGDGYLFEVCKRIIIAKNLQESIILMGSMGHLEVKQKMNESCIYIQHSVESFDGDSEGTPVAILEACAAGLAVVATNHAGISDVIEDGINGFLVEENDIFTMAERVVTLFKNQDLINRVGGQARNKILHHYTIEKNISELKKVIETAQKK